MEGIRPPRGPACDVVTKKRADTDPDVLTLVMAAAGGHTNRHPPVWAQSGTGPGRVLTLTWSPPPPACLRAEIKYNLSSASGDRTLYPLQEGVGTPRVQQLPAHPYHVAESHRRCTLSSAGAGALPTASPHKLQMAPQTGAALQTRATPCQRLHPRQEPGWEEGARQLPSCGFVERPVRERRCGGSGLPAPWVGARPTAVEVTTPHFVPRSSSLV